MHRSAQTAQEPQTARHTMRRPPPASLPPQQPRPNAQHLAWRVCRRRACTGVHAAPPSAAATPAGTAGVVGAAAPPSSLRDRRPPHSCSPPYWVTGLVRGSPARPPRCTPASMPAAPSAFRTLPRARGRRRLPRATRREAVPSWRGMEQVVCQPQLCSKLGNSGSAGGMGRNQGGRETGACR
eukprot:366462-Chlamydomonas_euryale.AAC.41